jgi:hypothetical protein
MKCFVKCAGFSEGYFWKCSPTFHRERHLKRVSSRKGESNIIIIFIHILIFIHINYGCIININIYMYAFTYINVQKTTGTEWLTIAMSSFLLFTSPCELLQAC